jgi:THO complex subunit 1
MPALDVQNAAVLATTEVRRLLDQLLVESETIKPIETAGNASSNIEPPLTKANFDDIPGRITQATSGISLRSSIENEDAAQDDLKARRMQIVEIAARDVFGRLIVSLPSRHCPGPRPQTNHSSFVVLDRH